MEKLFTFTRKIKLLTLILVGSLILNSAFFIIFFYFFIRENPIPIKFTYEPYFSIPEKTCSNADMVARFESLPFEKLSPLLGDTHHIEEGVTTRDLALSLLKARDQLDLDRIFGKVLSPPRFLRVNEEKTLPLFTQLSDDDFKKISEFIVLEKWPFTFEKLFYLVKEKGESADPSYLQMFFQSEEAFTLERIFSRGPIPLQKKVLLSLVREGSLQTLLNFCNEQKNKMDLSDQKRRSLLLQYLQEGSRTAAILLLYTDMPYLIKNIDDKITLTLLKLLPEKSEKGALYAAFLLNTLRSDAVKKEAALYLSRDKNIAKKLTHRPQETSLNFKSLSSNPPISQQHIVQPGESLWSISRKYNIALEKLVQINNLTSTSLQPGKIIKIP